MIKAEQTKERRNRYANFIDYFQFGISNSFVFFCM